MPQNFWTIRYKGVRLCPTKIYYTLTNGKINSNQLCLWGLLHQTNDVPEVTNEKILAKKDSSSKLIYVKLQYILLVLASNTRLLILVVTLTGSCLDYKITSENPSLVTAGCEGDAATGSVPISGSCSLEGDAPAGLLGILCRYP